MNRSPQKIVIVLMVLLMGLLPLQGAFASLNNMNAQMPASHQMSNDQVMPADCEYCDTDNHCDTQDCQTSHCASTTPAIANTTLQFEAHYSTAECNTTSSGIASFQSSLPFRPPIS